ncbi:MAG: sensor histidine kinase, partial [Odoribacter sp.]|nr:sensor histidine kinase [Odoribacter sp.]
TYYEVKSGTYKDIDYFALIRILDFYPYTSKYVKNKFAGFLKIPEENSDLLTMSLEAGKDGQAVKDKDGNILFFLTFAENYKERVPNYLLIFLYLLVFLSLFYVYSLILRNTVSWKKQLLWCGGFVCLLTGLRFFMQTFHLPPTVYSLSVFDEKFTGRFFFASVGDLILTTFCIFQLVYITLSNLRVNYENGKFRRYRYLIAGASLFMVFLYINFFKFSIDLLIENMDIHLNVARLVHVGLASILAFIAISLGGLIILVVLLGIVSVFQHILSFRQVLKVVTIICLLLWLFCNVFNLYANFWDCFFIWIIILLLAINRYLLKRDIQRGIYILVVFLLSVYMVMTSKRYEHYKELRQRMEYATELIEERDYNFEGHLAQTDLAIGESGELQEALGKGNEVEAECLLRERLLDMTGYNYGVDITFCHQGDSLWIEDLCEQWSCRDYFEGIIRQNGQQIGNTCFYAIGVFDGFVTYIGRFRFDDICLYLRFDAAKDDEGLGYPQILSRKSGDGKNNVYYYSYAKYAHGELVASLGTFVYYKKLKGLGKETHTSVSLLIKDQYSHMIIPVDNDNVLVISLPENVFALYYMNVLYAFIICIFISSYGLFFKVNRKINFQRGTLKSRIKNNVISLIFVLLVLLTGLSIYMNMRSFENRHKAKTIELLKYVNKELERLDCVDWQQCPDILETLSNMSELLMIDINIYSLDGELVSTSRPEIFQHGFDGMLVNPKAWQQIREKRVASYIANESIGELGYISAYMPLVLDNDQTYILNVPYFAQNDELNLDILIMIIIVVNIAIVMMVLAFILSGVMAERVTKPLQMVNEKLRKMHVGGKNEKIMYNHKDEIGILVREYNNVVDKLDESVGQLARSERENAWREMARQIAHEIKNPLTPMKLNIQFMLRSLQMEDPEKFRQRFKDISGMLIEQIDNLAAIASAFSDFAKISQTHNEVFAVDELVRNCTMLFKNNIDVLECDADTEVKVYADKEQMRRVMINLLKNAEQSIPAGIKGEIKVTVKRLGQQ